MSQQYQKQKKKFYEKGFKEGFKHFNKKAKERGLTIIALEIEQLNKEELDFLNKELNKISNKRIKDVEK